MHTGYDVYQESGNDLYRNRMKCKINIKEEKIMKNTVKKHLSTLLSLALIIAMSFSLIACGKQADADTNEVVVENQAENAAAADNSDATQVGEGAVQFTFEVVDGEGNTTNFVVNTDAATVGEALLGVDLIAGEDSEYGLYVKTVNGITADYDADQTYWAFYIDGEYASTGVDQTEVVAGSTYSFKVEK